MLVLTSSCPVRSQPFPYQSFTGFLRVLVAIPPLCDSFRVTIVYMKRFHTHYSVSVIINSGMADADNGCLSVRTCIDFVSLSMNRFVESCSVFTALFSCTAERCPKLHTLHLRLRHAWPHSYKITIFLIVCCWNWIWNTFGSHA